MKKGIKSLIGLLFGITPTMGFVIAPCVVRNAKKESLSCNNKNFEDVSFENSKESVKLDRNSKIIKSVNHVLALLQQYDNNLPNMTNINTNVENIYDIVRLLNLLVLSYENVQTSYYLELNDYIFTNFSSKIDNLKEKISYLQKELECITKNLDNPVEYFHTYWSLTYWLSGLNEPEVYEQLLISRKNEIISQMKELNSQMNKYENDICYVDAKNNLAKVNKKLEDLKIIKEEIELIKTLI